MLSEECLDRSDSYWQLVCGASPLATAGDYTEKRVAETQEPISCFSRSLQIIKELLTEYCIEYSKVAQDKTSLYRYKDNIWARSTTTDIRPISTVILDKSGKKELLKDIRDFLDQTARKLYSNCGIPYRRGYLLYKAV